MRDLKKLHNYSIEEQENMLPFERHFLLDLIQSEALKEADIPEQGWKQYADEVGATKPWQYTDKFKKLDYSPPSR